MYIGYWTLNKYYYVRFHTVSTISASQLNNSCLYISVAEYSPLLGGFSMVLSDGRAAFITASTLKFEPLVCNPIVVFGNIHVSLISGNRPFKFEKKC